MPKRHLAQNYTILFSIAVALTKCGCSVRTYKQGYVASETLPLRSHTALVAPTVMSTSLNPIYHKKDATDFNRLPYLRL